MNNNQNNNNIPTVVPYGSCFINSGTSSATRINGLENYSECLNNFKITPDPFASNLNFTLKVNFLELPLLR